MDGSFGKALLALAFYVSVIGLAGCSDLEVASGRSLWPFSLTKDTDSDPNYPAPADRISTLRELAEKASSAGPDERQRISSELAVQIRTETDPMIRVEIIRTLTGYRTATADSILRAALQDTDPDARIAACRAWATRGSEGVGMLAEALSSDVDPDVRLTAARALGQTGDRGAIAALGTALEDPDPAMQYCAVASLRKITGEDLGRDVDRWRQFVETGQVPKPERPISIAERLRRLF